MDFLQIEKITNKLLHSGLNYFPKILSAILILFLGWYAAKKITVFFMLMLQKSGVEKTLVHFFETLFYYALLIVVALSTLAQLGIDMTSFLTIMGAAGLAIGLALKETLGNIASGVVLIFFAPFKIGDFIHITGISGTVQKIGVFQTILTTADNQQIIIPNSLITGSHIINTSCQENRRVTLTIGISYKDSIAKARQIIEQIFKQDSRILENPDPSVVVAELAASSVNLSIRVWVKNQDYWAVFFDLNEKIKTAFDENGITIPYPQCDIHIKNDNQPYF